MKSQNGSNVGRTACNCYCCPFCKARIIRLQNMINKFFSIMKEYLPEQVQSLHQKYLELKENDQPSLGKVSRKSKHKREDKSVNIGSNSKLQWNHKNANPQINSLEQKGKTRKTLSFNQKKQIVQKIQQGIRNGEKVVVVCQRLGVSDRSYQRWKMKIDDRTQEYNQSSSEVVIHNPNI